MMDVEFSETAAAHLAVTSAAISGDSGGLYQIIAGLLDKGVSFESVLFDVLIPVERDLGDRWQQGDYLISEEHAATAAIETVIALLAGSFDQPSEGPSIVVATAEGDEHSLPARALSAHLLFLGHRTVLLGSSVLPSDLGEYLRAEAPRALALSCSMSTHLPGARAVIRESHQAGVPVITGGEGYGDDGRRTKAVGADRWVGSLREVADALEDWTPDIEAAEAGAADPGPELTLMFEHAAGLLASARHRIAERLSQPELDPRASTHLELILDAVGAAMLVDDVTVVTDMLTWQEATMLAQGLDLGDSLVDAVIGALQGDFSTAADLLREASDPTRSDG